MPDEDDQSQQESNLEDLADEALTHIVDQLGESNNLPKASKFQEKGGGFGFSYELEIQELVEASLKFDISLKKNEQIERGFPLTLSLVQLTTEKGKFPILGGNNSAYTIGYLSLSGENQEGEFRFIPRADEIKLSGRKGRHDRFDGDHLAKKIGEQIGAESVTYDKKSRMAFQLPADIDLKKAIQNTLKAVVTDWASIKRNTERLGINDTTYDSFFFPEEESNLLARLEDSSNLDELPFPEELEKHCQLLLASGKHLIITGPPGFGKTELAYQLARRATGDNFVSCTASPAWTTDDLIGRYLPSSNGQGLTFEPGYFLKAISKKRDNFLVIDEINRCDLDSCFGELFTILSNKRTELPYVDEFENEGDEEAQKENIVAGPLPEKQGTKDPWEYFFGDDFRIIGTMNTKDAGRLHEFSDALHRRFAFVEISSDHIKNNAERIITKIAGKRLWNAELFRTGYKWHNLIDVLQILLESGSDRITPATISEIFKLFKEIRNQNGGAVGINNVKAELKQAAELLLKPLKERVSSEEWSLLNAAIQAITE